MQTEATELKQALKDTGHTGFTYREPYGGALIIGPFNAPLILTFEPAITAFSAGNSCILTPTEATSNSTALLMELVPVYLNQK